MGTKWLGLVTNADKRDIPPGAATVQTNVTTETDGKLSVRRGSREVSFTNHTARTAPADPDASLADIVGMFYFHRPEANMVVMQYSDGTVRVGKVPA